MPENRLFDYDVSKKPRCHFERAYHLKMDLFIIMNENEIRGETTLTSGSESVLYVQMLIVAIVKQGISHQENI